MDPRTDRSLPQQARPGRRTRVLAWLQLFRAPNLLTVPGDPVAGFLLAQAAGGHVACDLRMLWCAAASLLLYGAGLLANDYFDLAEDRRQRPDRPLPAGEVRPRTVICLAAALAAGGIAMAGIAGRSAMLVAAILAAAVFLYDVAGKGVPLLGPLVMGACRGLSLLMGAAALGPDGLRQPLALAGGVGLTLYIAAVSQIARGETGRARLGKFRWAPGVVLGAWFIALWALGRREMHVTDLLFAVLAFWAVGRTLLLAAHLGASPSPAVVPPTVGSLLRGLLVIQAALAAMAPWQGLLAAGILLAAMPMAAWLGRRFYAS